LLFIKRLRNQSFFKTNVCAVFAWAFLSLYL
jgi:hypothetical protein